MLSIKSTQVQLQDLRPPGASAFPALPLAERLRAFVRQNILFAVLCLMPTFAAAVYFGAIAADFHVSSVRYVVRTSSTGGFSPLSMGNSGPSSSNVLRSNNDTYLINAFMTSRDAVAMLQRDVNLDRIYAQRGMDAISAFPRPFGNNGMEALFRHYERLTRVSYDSTTGIATLVVSAYDPKDAHLIARRLMAGGEALANRLTERMRRDLVERSVQDTAISRQKVIEAQQQIAQWRAREQIVDPTRYSAAVIEVIARLSLELAQLRAQIAEIRRASPQSPSIPSLQNRVTSLQEQIEIERRALTGGTGSLAPRIVEYELLLLEKSLAEQQYGSIVRAQEMARSDAQRQQIYVEWIAEPKIADYPDRPYRIISTIVVFLLSFMIFAIFNTIAVNLRKHGALSEYFGKV